MRKKSGTKMVNVHCIGSQDEEQLFPIELMDAYLRAFLGLVCLFVLRFFYRVLTDPLRDVPGPPLARYTRLWELFTLIKGQTADFDLELHKRYGPILRLSPNRHSVHDSTAIRTIYGVGSKFDKSKFYVPFGNPNPWAKDMFSERTGARYAIVRKKASALYTISALVSYEPFVDKVNGEFMDKLDDFAREGGDFDLFTWMQFYALDVIGEITLGRSFGLLAAGRDKDKLLRAIHTANFTYGSCVGIYPEVHYWYFVITMLLPIDTHFKVMLRVLAKELGDRYSGTTSPDREDFKAKCLNLIKAGKMNDNDLQNTIGQNVGAGSDTTGISLTAVIYFLMKHPRCLRKLHEEIEEAEREGRLSQPVKFQEGQKLVYLQACIKEALGVFPAGSMILPRVVPPGGVEIAGKFFPAGTEVGMSGPTLHNDESVWGADAHEFRPERWFVLKEEVAMLDKHFFAFGMRARTCIGKNISMLEMTKLLLELLRRFDFEPAQEGDWTRKGGWFVRQYYQVRVRQRAI